MAEVKFVQKEPTSETSTLIYLLFRFNNQKVKYSTGEKIHPKFWNPEKQRAKATRTNEQHLSLNTKLDNLTTCAKNTHRDLINANLLPTPYKIKDALNRSLFEEEYSQKIGLLKFINELITTSNRKRNTLNQWKQTLRKLVEFKKAGNREVDFDTIDLNFYN